MIAGSLTIEMAANIARLQQDMNQAKQIVGAAAKSMEAAASGVTSALKTIASGLTIAALVNKIDSVTEHMASLKDASEKTGASVENLSKLKFFAETSGSNIEAVTLALTKLSKGMVATGNEGAPTSQALKFLGLSAKDAAGNLKDPSQLMGQIAKQLAVYEDGAGKAAIAQALFGKAGADMLPTLKTMAEMGDIVASVTTAQARAADEYQDKLKLLHRQKEILWNTIVSALLPSMQSMVEFLLKGSQEANSMGNAVKGLANDHSIESFADRGAMAIAFLIDAFKTIPEIAKVVTAQLTAAVGLVDVLGKAAIVASPVSFATAKARGENPVEDLQTAYRAMGMAQADADAKMKAFLGSEVDANRKAMAKIIADRKAATEAAARDQESSSRPGGETGKKLNFSMGDAAKMAAELKQFTSALQQLEQELGGLNHQTVEQKTLYQVTTGSLKLLTEAHKQELLVVARKIDAKKTEEAVTKSFIAAIEAQISAQEALDAGMNQFFTTNTKFIKDLQFETSIVGMNTLERKNATDARKIQSEFDAQSTAISGAENLTLTEKNKLIAELTITRNNLLAQTKTENEINAAANALNVKNIEQIQFETKLIGMNNTEREQAIAIRQLELTGIDKNSEAFKKYAGELKGAIAEKNFAEESKTVLVGMWGDVDRVAHDTFVSIFDAGKSSFDRLRDALKNGLYSLLYQMTLRPFLVQIVTSSAGPGVAQSVFGAAATSGGGIGGIGNLSSLSNLLPGGGLLGSSAAYAAAVPGLASFGAGSQAAMLAAQTGVFGAEGLAATAVSGGASAAAGGAMAAIGTALPYIGIALAAGSMLGLFGGGGHYAQGLSQQYTGGYSGGGGLNLNSTGITDVGPDPMHNFAPDDVNYQKLSRTLEGTVADIERLAKDAGIDASSVRSKAVSFDLSGELHGPTEADLQKILGSVANQLVDGLIPGMQDMAKSGESLLQTYVRLTSASFAVKEAEKQRLAQLAQQQHQLDIQVMELQGKSAEALASRRADELEAIDPTLRATQQLIYALQDQAVAADAAAKAEEQRSAQIRTAEDVLRQAYRAQASELEQTITKWGDAAKSLRSYGLSLFGGGAGLSYGEASRQFNAVSTQARLGDFGAIGNLQSVSEVFLQASEKTSATAIDYMRDLARVENTISATADVADRQSDIAQRQLDRLTRQVEALVVIDGKLASVEEAVDGLAKVSDKQARILERWEAGGMPQVRAA